MFVVMGATGHVGAAVADTLLAEGQEVTVVTRRPDHAGAWHRKGARVVAADAEDPGSLRDAFRLGRRAFLLNPPADPAGDTDAAERRTIARILTALDGSGLEKVVAASTYGAQPGGTLGDLGALWELEEGLRRQPIPAAINRGAYYMSNWTALADVVRASGALPSMFPADTLMPMVAPEDLGRAAAARLLSPTDDVELRHVEGSARYTPRNVADTFAAVLGRDVEVAETPRDRWEETYRSLGFSDSAARSYAGMTAASLDQDFAKPEAFERGRITLREFIADALAG